MCVCVWDLIRSPDLKKRFRDRKEMSEIGLNLWLLLLLLLMLWLFCFSDAMVGKEFVKGEEIAERKTSGTNQSLSTKICINSRRRREKFEDERKKKKSCPPRPLLSLVIGECERESREG